MKNEGYYSWIHSLKSAAIKSQQKGFYMLNEQKATKITDAAKQAALGSQLSATPTATVRPMRDAQSRKGERGQDILDIRDEQGKVVHRATESELTAMMIQAIRDKEAGGVRGYEPASPDSVELAGGDPAALISSRRAQDLLARQREADISKIKGPINSKPAGSANDVANDAKDGVVEDDDILPADPSFFKIPSAAGIPEQPPLRVHPPAIYKTAADAAGAVAALNLQMNPRTPAEEIEADLQAQEEEEREDYRRAARYENTRRVNNKIFKLIGEEAYDESPSELQSTDKVNKTKESVFDETDLTPPAGMFAKEFTPGERLGKILGIINNPKGHPPEHIRYAHVALSQMQDLFK